MYYLAKTFSFEAAHMIESQLAEYKNKQLHGHSFMVEIEIKGDINNKDGWVKDLGKISEECEKMKKILDHSFLNEIDGLEKPTMENIAKFISERIKLENLYKVIVMRPSLGEKVTFVIED